jgi:hypothetical protein
MSPTKIINVYVVNAPSIEPPMFTEGTMDATTGEVTTVRQADNRLSVPLVRDGLEKEDELEVRLYMHRLYSVVWGAAVKTTIYVPLTTDEPTVARIIDKHALDDQIGYAEVLEDAKAAATAKIEEVNKRTTEKKKRSDADDRVKVPRGVYAELIAAAKKAVSERDDALKIAESVPPSYRHNIPIPNVPEAFERLLEFDASSVPQEPAATVNPTADEEDKVDDEQFPTEADDIPEDELKPPAVEVRLDPGTEPQEDLSSDPSDANVPDERTNQPFAEATAGFEDGVYDYGPTREVISRIAKKIKDSAFGRMKHVRTLQDGIEIVLAYATWLFAVVGSVTVSNAGIEREHDWWMIRESDRTRFINGFYAAYNNYRWVVQPGCGSLFRHERVSNGLVAALTTMISTAIGATDEVFMRTIDDRNWARTVYPFVAGHRPLGSSHLSIQSIIKRGQLPFKRHEGGRREYFIPEGIFEFLNPTMRLAALQDIGSDTEVDKAQVRPEDRGLPDDDSDPLDTDYAAWEGPEEVDSHSDDSTVTEHEVARSLVGMTRNRTRTPRRRTKARRLTRAQEARRSAASLSPFPSTPRDRMAKRMARKRTVEALSGTTRLQEVIDVEMVTPTATAGQPTPATEVDADPPQEQQEQQEQQQNDDPKTTSDVESRASKKARKE